MNTVEEDWAAKNKRLESFQSDSCLDIYELDSKVLTMQDFMKSLEMSAHRMATMVDDVG